MKKRALALALVLCMVLALAPVSSAAALTKLPLPALAPAARPAELVQPQADTYSITMSYTGPGVAEIYATSAGALERVYFLADPEPGYAVSFAKCGYFKEQYDLELRYIGGNIYEITMPDGDVILDLEFVAIETAAHAVTLAAAEGGTATVDRETAKAGESLFVDVVTEPGYTLESVKGKSASGWNPGYYLGRNGDAERYEILMPDEDMEIQIAFRRNGPYTITTYIDSDPAGGTVELSHESAYELETVTVTALPDVGYAVASVSCYHSKPTQTGENTWTFPMPRFNEEVHVSFEAVSYSVGAEVEEPVGGAAWLDAESALYGQEVTLTCEPLEGYRVARITGVEELTDNGDNTFTFVMPAEPVELQILFLRQNNPFLDVTEERFYHDSVLWAVENGITSGVSADRFGPNQSCTRGQVVTFLWRAAGSPEPELTEHPFTDVEESAFYYKAMLWAVENGITSGVSADSFAPMNACTRGQVVTFLWRANGEPAAESRTHGFTDVSEIAFYYEAMLWAVENGVTSGVSATAFAPGNTCTRGQVVTFLHRADQIPEPEPMPEPEPEPEPFPGLS